MSVEKTNSIEPEVIHPADRSKAWQMAASFLVFLTEARGHPLSQTEKDMVIEKIATLTDGLGIETVKGWFSEKIENSRFRKKIRREVREEIALDFLTSCKRMKKGEDYQFSEEDLVLLKERGLRYQK